MVKICPLILFPMTECIPWIPGIGSDQSANWPATSVTRLGNLLDFGQILKTLVTINLPKLPTFFGNFCKGVKIITFCGEIIFCQLF